MEPGKYVSLLMTEVALIIQPTPLFLREEKEFIKRIENVGFYEAFIDLIEEDFLFRAWSLITDTDDVSVEGWPSADIILTKNSERNSDILTKIGTIYHTNKLEQQLQLLIEGETIALKSTKFDIYFEE